MTEKLNKYYKDSIDTLNHIGIALSSENDRTHLLKSILAGAMQITNCDAGTLYLIHKDTLAFSIIANKTLGIAPSHILETNITLLSIPLFIGDRPNTSNVATCCYHKDQVINIDDAYQDKTYDFSGTKLADEKLNYLSKSFLCIPLRNHEGSVIGVLQLINALDENRTIISFDEDRVLFAESLASQAAITLTKHELILAQRKLFEAILHLIADAIDAKSKHTSNHCTRVPIITNMLANALNKTTDGPLKDKHLTADEVDELMISSWLHDCGKISTPDHVVNKSTKLETISDRIEMINDRFEILKRDARIEFLEHKKTEHECNIRIGELEQMQAYLNKVNIGGEYLSDEEKTLIRTLGVTNQYFDGRDMKPLLTDNEINNLCISRGTLNQEEREIIQNHAKITYDMLKRLPYPSNLRHVPDIAGAHHERIDGKGYPHGKKDDQLSVQARILAIADIFEALTAPDRPYKKPKPLSEVISIMTQMKESGHIDANLFNLFINDKVYLEFANQYLNPDQIDA